MKLVSALSVCSMFCTAADAAVVGSFDENRINCGGGVFATGSYETIRSELAIRGDSIRSLPLLSASTLSGTDIFYTSLLSYDTGGLSASEQVALSDWVKNGGTLIVAGETFQSGLAIQTNYNSFLRPFGINLQSWSASTPEYATVVDFSSPITNGPNGLVTSFIMAGSGRCESGNFTTLAVEDGEIV